MKTPISLSISPGGPPDGRPGGWWYKQPETGQPFHTTGINALYKKIYVHRAALGLDISIGWQGRLHHQLCEQMPWIACEEVITNENNPLLVAGRKHWKELHDYASHEGSMETAQAFMTDWRNRIPSFGCSCRRHFDQIELARPVDLSSREKFYQWTVDIHNDVNRSLGKPVWPFTT